ncbi:transmembrane protein [Oleiphilus messinensis]|uniref:Transmembrane protein n=1 Tax=Oleiphilus messinensis TaxID=141451 RepID=A0A1Y0IEC5_9GAMM|nr:hypothetical protein [Oleiphilus messinensis]ARU58887.1 transmembrane protein [Oleiphilus messinensis]
MHLLKHVPLFAVILIIYNITAFMGEGSTPMEAALFSLNLVSGATLTLTLDMFMVLLGLLVMFIELLKATRSSVASVIDHGLSTVVLIVFILELILVKNTGTPGFLVLTILAFLDVVAGFTVTISSARRDVMVEH